MTHRLATNYVKNYCNRTLTVKVIVENVVTCFLGTQCILLGLRHHEIHYIQTGLRRYLDMLVLLLTDIIYIDFTALNNESLLTCLY